MSLPKPPLRFNDSQSGLPRPFPAPARIGSVPSSGPAKPGEREGKVETNEKAQEAQVRSERSDDVHSEFREVEGAVESSTPDSQEDATSAKVLVFRGRVGHEVTIVDQVHDPTQFFRWYGKCKCGWETRQDFYEWARKFAEVHVAVHQRS